MLSLNDRVVLSNIIRTHAHMLEAKNKPLLLPQIARRHRQATRVLKEGGSMVEASPFQIINGGDTAQHVIEASQP